MQSILFKKKELDLPKWDGNISSWNTMHDKLIAELADLSKLYILQETYTTPATAPDSKLLYNAFWKKFSGKALAPFSGQAHLYVNKGIEMYGMLLSLYAPVSNSALLSLSKKLSDIKMTKTEDVINFVQRIRLLNSSLAQNGQQRSEALLVLTAIKGLDVIRYIDLISSFWSGVHSPTTF